MNFNNVLFLFFTSIQFFVVLIVIFVSAVVINFTPEYSTICTVVCLFVFSVLTYINLEVQNENNKADESQQKNYTISTTCGWIWVFWLFYLEVSPIKSIPETPETVKSTILIGLVILTYLKWRNAATHFIFAGFLYTVLLPTMETPYDSQIYKAILYIVLYSIVDLEGIILEKITEENIVAASKKSITPIYVCSKEVGHVTREVLITAEQQIIKSSWVLFAPSWCLFVAIFQILYTIINIKIRLNKKIAPVLPIVSNEKEVSKSLVGPTKRKKQKTVILHQQKNTKTKPIRF